MRYLIIILSFFTLHGALLTGQTSAWSSDESLRIDFVLSGNAKETTAAIFELKKEPFWGGSPKQKDYFNYGEFRIVIQDTLKEKVLYSRGFCTLYEEWQTTDEAFKINKAFQQSVVCPFPNKKVNVSIERRNRDGVFYNLLETVINPEDYSIKHFAKSNVKTHKIVDNGSAEECVDIVFVGDGYTKEEMDKFHNDVKRLTDFLFKQAPFDKLQSKFNIWAVDVVSENSGMTDPRKNIWKNTALKSSFNTLNSDRYLESEHTYEIRDYAGLVPYDQIYVIANTTKYGGGGIYNHFSLTSADNERSLVVCVHEFGHGFAGLGDEYYTSSTSYNDFFNQAIEPWQPNLTTMVDFESKWIDMIDKTVPVPTPAEDKYNKTVGAYEGGGYVAKGIYRPMMDCRMKTNEAEGFCPVCQRAIEKMVLFLTNEL